MKRNLVYHIYPVSGPVWLRNVRRLNDFADVFNGRVIISIAIDEKTEHFKKVIPEFKFPRPEFVVVPNDPKAGEGNTFRAMLSEIKSDDPHEATFYAHAKGTHRHIVNPEMTQNVWSWVECMYHLNLSNIPLIERILQKYPAVGCYKRIGNHGGGSWHFGGTFFWFRHSEIFRGPWDKMDPGYFGVEGWIGKQLPPKKGFCLYNSRWRHTDKQPTPPEDYADALEVAGAQLTREGL